MDEKIIIAIAHIVGSIIAVFVIDIFLLIISSIEEDVISRKSKEEFSIVLGVSPEEAEDEIHFLKTLKYMEGKYTSELLRNRISDLCGIIRTLWKWTGAIAKLITICCVIWLTISEDINTAIFSWSIVGIHLFFIITSVIFSYLCLLLTGRSPGQAKNVRKYIADWLRDNSELVHRLQRGEQ